MSGGIDSTIAAILLQQQGYELEGVTFRTFDDSMGGISEEEKSCCSLKAVEEARQVAKQLGINHHILDFRQVFKDYVVADFIYEYMQGRTPNPCVVCNSSIKWGMLLQKADELGCDFIATGHYARIKKLDNLHFLATAVDIRKDQTYFLWKLTAEELARTLFPLGGYTKPEVRQMAANLGMVALSQKKESQEICFIPDNDYRRFLSDNVEDFAERCVPGDYVDSEGKYIGTHEGYPFYTIGQRKGLKVALGTPKYVTHIDAQCNRVVLGNRDDLFTMQLWTHKLSFIDRDRIVKNPWVQARIRYKSPATRAKINLLGDEAELCFEEPVWGVTPGQSVVFYQEDCVVGGGIIKG